MSQRLLFLQRPAENGRIGGLLASSVSDIYNLLSHFRLFLFGWIILQQLDHSFVEILLVFLLV